MSHQFLNPIVAQTLLSNTGQTYRPQEITKLKEEIEAETRLD